MKSNAVESGMRCLWVTLLSVCAVVLCAPAAHADAREQFGVVTQPPVSPVDRIIVRKSERRMYLMTGDEVLRAYHVSLGLSPVGRKDRSGDYRTPEGSYRLGKRNPRSDYYLSIQINYPNRDDIARARRNGWQPGGSIMIHGLPNLLRKDPEYYLTQDWTNGCIAVSNADMLEIWTLVSYNTPIDIVP